MEPETPRDRSSLRDVARFAAPAGMTTPAAKREARRATADSSGVVDLEALMKQNPQWLDDALSRAKGQDRASLPGGSSPALSSAILAPPSLAPTAYDDVPVGVPKNNMALIGATLGALLLIGGAVAFALHSPAKAPAPVAAANVVQVAPPESHAEDPIPPPPPAAEVANAAAPAATAPAADSQEDTAQAAAADAPEEPTAPGRHGHHGGHAVHHAALSHATAMAAAPAAPPAPAAKPVKGGSALDAALRNAMGPAGSLPSVPGVGANAPAAAAAAPAPAPVSSDRPERPSQGALTSALTAVMPAAKSCVAGTSGPSHATITFGSNGNVRSIDLTGPAGSDHKVGSCVKSALNRAHVPAFSQSTYPAGVNIRP